MRVDTNNGAAGNVRSPMRKAGSDSISQNIEKQIERLEERIRETAANEDMPADIKTEQQNLLNEQIAQLRQQLFARRRELQLEKTAVEPAKQLAPDDSQQTISMPGAQIQAVVSADSAMKQIKAKEKVRNSLNGEAKKLGYEISLDEARGLDVTDKLTSLSAIESKVDAVTGDMVKDMADAVKLFKDAAEQEAAASDNEDKTADITVGNEKQDEDNAKQAAHIDAFV